MTEHGTKGRIVGRQLKLRMAIGYTTKEVIKDENSQYFIEENCLLYSQKPDLPKSPEAILTSSKIKSQNWDVKVKVENLLNCLYNDENSPLFHGFLKPHKVAFSLAISLFIKSGAENRGENKAFHKALHSDNEILDEAGVEQYILKPYNERGNYNATFGYKPKRGLYPPTNTSDKSPPDFNEWHNGQNSPNGRNNNGNTANGNIGNNANATIEGASSNALVSILGQIVQQKNNSANCNDVNTDTAVSVSTKHKTVTFSCNWDPFPEAIIIDEVKLTLKSTMKMVLEHIDGGDKSFSEYNILEESCKNLYFQVKAKDGFNDISIKKSHFMNMTIEDIDNLDHSNDQIIITVVDRNNMK